MRRIKFLEIKSELGARKLGASLGIGAVRIAALNAKSTIFQRPDFERIKPKTIYYFRVNQVAPMRTTSTDCRYYTTVWPTVFAVRLTRTFSR
ncbi:MAG: hypothetical protein LBL90_00930 [Prevotellaceae bacterium]|jgi:hypothetical protein|nr:hypothetical protein [Prevotellaceae bacterium]